MKRISYYHSDSPPCFVLGSAMSLDTPNVWAGQGCYWTAVDLDCNVLSDGKSEKGFSGPHFLSHTKATKKRQSHR